MEKIRRHYFAAITIILSGCMDLSPDNELLNLSCRTPIVDNQVTVAGTATTFTAANQACSQKASYYSVVLTKDKTMLTIQLGGTKLPTEAATFYLTTNSLAYGTAHMTLTTPTITYQANEGNLYFTRDNGRISLEFCSIVLNANNYLTAEVTGRVICQ